MYPTCESACSSFITRVSPFALDDGRHAPSFALLFAGEAHATARFHAETIKGPCDGKDRRSNRSASFFGLLLSTHGQLLIATVMCAKASFGLWRGGVVRVVLSERRYICSVVPLSRLAP
jgi:hypothetical protein